MDSGRLILACEVTCPFVIVWGLSPRSNGQEDKDTLRIRVCKLWCLRLLAPDYSVAGKDYGKKNPILEPVPIWTGMYKDINLDESFVFANISFTWLQIRRSFKKDL